MTTSSASPKNVWDTADVLFFITEAAPQANEELASAYARAEYRRNPELFSGNQQLVYHKQPYTPPYDNAFELRSLILKAKEAAGFNPMYRGLIALDIEEWIGHEEEEYFSILLAFLSDHCQYWRYLFIVGTHSEDDLSDMLRETSRYLTPACYNEFSLFKTGKATEAYIKQLCTKMEYEITPGALHCLGLLYQQHKKLRDPIIIERVMRDIAAFGHGNKVIDESLLEEYSNNKNVLLSYLAGPRVLIAEKEI